VEARLFKPAEGEREEQSVLGRTGLRVYKEEKKEHIREKKKELEALSRRLRHPREFTKEQPLRKSEHPKEARTSKGAPPGGIPPRSRPPRTLSPHLKTGKKNRVKRSRRIENGGGGLTDIRHKPMAPKKKGGPEGGVKPSMGGKVAQAGPK